MTREEAKKYLMDISYEVGTIGIEYLSVKDGEKMREAIKALEQEPKTIQEKQAESEKYDKAFDDGYEHGYAQARFDYEQEPKTGHWNPIHVSNIWRSVFSCSECGKSVCIYISLGRRLYSLYNRCPSCHARMVEPQESEDEE